MKIKLDKTDNKYKATEDLNSADKLVIREFLNQQNICAYVYLRPRSMERQFLQKTSVLPWDFFRTRENILFPSEICMSPYQGHPCTSLSFLLCIFQNMPCFCYK